MKGLLKKRLFPWTKVHGLIEAEEAMPMLIFLRTVSVDENPRIN
jgi:hypothetical protein